MREEERKNSFLLLFRYTFFSSSLILTCKLHKATKQSISVSVSDHSLSLSHHLGPSYQDEAGVMRLQCR